MQMKPGNLAALAAVVVAGSAIVPATAAAASLKLALSTSHPVVQSRFQVIADGTTDVSDPNPATDAFFPTIFFDRGATSTAACAPTAEQEGARITEGPDNHIGTTGGGITGSNPPDSVGPGPFHFSVNQVFIDAGPEVMCGYLERRDRTTQEPSTTIATAALPFTVRANRTFPHGRGGNPRARALARAKGFRRCRALHPGNRPAVGHCYAQVIRRYPF